MQRLLGIILFSYFLSGTLLLPQGDFATLPDLPRMYAHCRETEDHDLTIADFIEEHLLMMDDLMGEPPEPQDKPHQPVQFHHIYAPVTIAIRQDFKVEGPSLPLPKQLAPIINDVYLSDYPASVFRPPIL
jgi:hypothetical protein